MAKAEPRRKKAVAADGFLVAIRALDDNNELIEKFISGKSAQTIVRMAMRWGYVLRVRTRWAGDADMREYFGEKAIEDLEDLGIKRDAVQQFASAKHIEVELYGPALTAADPASVLDAASEMPWEYLLSSATQNVGRVKELLVTRCLSNGAKTTPTRPRSVLFVESAPGRIGLIYRFDDEETRLKAAVDLEEGRGLEFSRTEPFSKLAGRIRKKAWQAIHVTGVDTHHAAWEIEDFYTGVARRGEVIDESDRLHDGMILRGDYDSELPVRYDELAKLLLASKKPAHVITLNLYYSGARTARELVKRGAYAALGFLDEIDDEFAEFFFQAFYWAWCHDEKSVPDAFLDAWSQMDGDRMHGTSIIIWLGRSIVGGSETSSKRPKKVKNGSR